MEKRPGGRCLRDPRQGTQQSRHALLGREGAARFVDFGLPTGGGQNLNRGRAPTRPLEPNNREAKPPGILLIKKAQPVWECRDTRGRMYKNERNSVTSWAPNKATRLCWEEEGPPESWISRAPLGSPSHNRGRAPTRGGMRDEFLNMLSLKFSVGSKGAAFSKVAPFVPLPTPSPRYSASMKRRQGTIFCSS